MPGRACNNGRRRDDIAWPGHGLASRAPSSQPFPAAVERFVGIFSRPLTWLWSRGFRMLGALDAVTLYLLMVAISFVRFGFSFDWPTYPMSHYVVGFSIATAINITVNYFAGSLRTRAASRPTAVAAQVLPRHRDRRGGAGTRVRRARPLSHAAPQSRPVPRARLVRPRVQPRSRPAADGASPGPAAGDPGGVSRSHRTRRRPLGGERSQRHRGRPTRASAPPRRLGGRTRCDRRPAARRHRIRLGVSRAAQLPRIGRRRLPPARQRPRDPARPAVGARDRRHALRHPALPHRARTQGAAEADLRPRGHHRHDSDLAPGRGDRRPVRPDPSRRHPSCTDRSGSDATGTSSSA